MDNIIERLEKYSVANKVEFRNEIRELEIQRRKWYKMIVTLEEIINSYEKAERNAKNQSLFKQNLIGYINLKPTKNFCKFFVSKNVCTRNKDLALRIDG